MGDRDWALLPASGAKPLAERLVSALAGYVAPAWRRRGHGESQPAAVVDRAAVFLLLREQLSTRR
jgi:alpha-beta hydrolase superfamily lysophospholipase